MSEKRGPLAFVRRIVGKVEDFVSDVEIMIEDKAKEELRAAELKNEPLEDRVEELETDLAASKRAYQERAERVRRDMQRQLDEVSPKLKEAAAIVNRQNAELQEFRSHQWKYDVAPGAQRILDAERMAKRYEMAADELRVENEKLRERATAQCSLGSMGRLEKSLDDALDKNEKLEERTRVAELLARKYMLEKSKAYTKLSEVMSSTIDVWVTRMAGQPWVQIWKGQPSWDSFYNQWVGENGLRDDTGGLAGYMRVGRLSTMGPGPDNESSS